jgi:hypothetical protein
LEKGFIAKFLVDPKMNGNDIKDRDDYFAYGRRRCLP